MPDFIVDGTRLRYEQTGGKGQVVVFLNGIAMTIGHWKAVMQAMGEGFRFLCHDFRGQTLSDKPAGPYSFDLHAADLAALMDSLGIENAHVVGTSYGSEVGMAFAASYPEHCASLAVIDGVSELDPVLEAAVDSWKAAAAADPKIFYKTLLPWTYSAAYLSANKSTLRAREDAMSTFPKAWFGGFVALCDAFLAINLTPRLKDIHCPTKVLVGDKDILKHLSFAKIIADGIAGASLGIIEGAGHASVVEMPDRIAWEISTFIGGVRI
ncbi:MAG: alpha/beta hydrolase [Spirochaetes bacterium]|nr:alpha/beta hydrolase [Spirochaetota bacterium]